MRILTLDIETSPNLAYVWSIWQENIPLQRLIETGSVICWAAKWHGQSKVHFGSDFHDGHEEQIRRIHELISEADAVITYNGKGFDNKHLNSEFLLQGLTPPPPAKQIDLFQVVKATFRFPSNKLDYVSQRLGIGAKGGHNGFGTWVGCMNGDEKAWRDMKRYNVQDVRLTEELFDKLRPWIRVLPHPALYGAMEDCCPACGGSNLRPQGYARTQVSTFQRFQCADCGKWSRSAKPLDRATLRGL